MKTPRIVLFVLLAASVAGTQAQDKPAPALPASSAQTEMQKWIATTDAQWQAVFKRDVTDVREAEMNKLKIQYLTSLETAIGKASAASDLKGALALRNEQKRFGDTNVFLEQDDPADAAQMKQLRAVIRVQIAKLEKDHAARAKVLHAKYDQALAQAQDQLTQRQRLDDALLVKNKREEVSAAWLAGTPVPAASVPVPVQSKPASATGRGNARIADATKDRPFENGLGMKFVPVPITGGPSGGQRVLFSVWETRERDYGAYLRAKGEKRGKADASREPMHPAVNVSWESAKAFCEWLTGHERKAQRLGAAECYRLPTDHEWSCAVGIGEQEDAAKAPEEKNGKIPDVFPWGNAWPPPPGAGNFCGDEASRTRIYASQKWLDGYRDPFPAMAPVGSFAANGFGIFDLCGNVWEWCEDGPPGKDDHVMRGSAWAYGDRASFLSSTRFLRASNHHRDHIGFRIVLSAVEPAR